MSINAHVFEAARAQGIRLSALLEEAIRQKLAEQEKERWLTENKQAIKAYNEDVSARGVFLDGLRSF